VSEPVAVDNSRQLGARGWQRVGTDYTAADAAVAVAAARVQTHSRHMAAVVAAAKGSPVLAGWDTSVEAAAAAVEGYTQAEEHTVQRAAVGDPVVVVVDRIEFGAAREVVQGVRSCLSLQEDPYGTRIAPRQAGSGAEG
jgi:hypothetical protein